MPTSTIFLRSTKRKISQKEDSHHGITQRLTIYKSVSILIDKFIN